MLFKNVLGLEHIKNHLVTTAETGRVAHAQLFVGPEGSGVLPMAIAYAQYLLCGNIGGENEGSNSVCNTKCNSLTHPDLHFDFPVSNSDKIKSHAVSDHYLEEWRQFVKEQPYGNLFDWYRLIGIEKKQGQIGVDEAQDMVKKLSLKSYEGGYKVLIVWMAEKMNVSAANKLLKLIEEPPNKTVLLLLAEDEEQIINTIRSRCQILNFPPLAEQVITDELLARGVAQTEALTIALRPTAILTRPWISSTRIWRTWCLNDGLYNGFGALLRRKVTKGPFKNLFYGAMKYPKLGAKSRKSSLATALP